MRNRAANLLVWLGALLVFLVAPVSSAFAEVELGKRLALVVGNSSYQQIKSLKNAAADAGMVAQTLSDLGFQVTLLQNATLPQMKAAVSAIKADGADAEAVLFYYSGHGFQLNGSNFLVPADATLKNRDTLGAETMELNTLISELGNSSRPTIILIDACRDNPLSADVLGPGAVSTGLAQVNASVDNTYVLFSTQPGNVSHDGAGANGPFALALQANLPLPDEDFVAVMKQVRADVKKRTAGLQTPWEQSSMLVDFEFNIGLMPGVLIADLSNSGAPVSAGGVSLDAGPGIALDAGGDLVADTPLAIEGMPEDLIRGTQVQGGPEVPLNTTTTVTPSVAALPKDNTPPTTPIAPTTPETTVAAIDPKEITGPSTPTVPGDNSATVTPSVTPPVEEGPDPVKVAELLQSALKRVGCYTSVVDGDWGNGSRKALKKYFDTKKIAPLGTEPTMEIVNALAAEPGIVCEPEPVVTQPKKPAVADNDGPSTPVVKKPSTPSAPAEPKKKPGGLVIKPGSGSFR
jgi:hypothetical protein